MSPSYAVFSGASHMTIELTATGWTDLLGNSNPWTSSSDFVYGQSLDSTPAVAIAGGVVASAGGGNDSVSGFALSNGTGFTVQGELQMNRGDDVILGFSQNSIGIAILSTGIIGTGKGDDKIIGQGDIGISISSGGFLQTKVGDDVIFGSGIGSGSVGIFNQGTIEMDVAADEGNDVLQGVGSSGVFNSGGTITFGGGNDTLVAVSTDSSSADLFNNGEIRMGSGADTLLLGGTGLMDGGGDIFLGAGGDTLVGFGDMTVDAGDGVNDTLILPSSTAFAGGQTLVYTVAINEAAGTVSFISGIGLTARTMTTTGFENLIYADQTFAFSELTNGQTLTV